MATSPIDLCTYLQYQSIIGTPAAASDQLLVQSTLITAASAAIKRFINRHIPLKTYVEWVGGTNNAGGVFYPLEYPVVALYSVNKATQAFTVQNNSAFPVVFVVQDDQFQVYNPVTNTSVVYLYSAYATVGALLAKLATDRPDLPTTLILDATMSTSLLRPATVTIQAGVTGAVEGGVAAMTGHVEENRIVFGTDLSVVWTTQDFPGYVGIPGEFDHIGQICLVYSAGYATIPSDLVYTTCNIVRDMLFVANGKRSTGVKHESVAQYAYDVLDGVSFDALCETKYAHVLAQWRRVII